MVVDQKQTEALLWLALSLSSSQAPAPTAAPNSPQAHSLAGTGGGGCTASAVTRSLVRPTTTACTGTPAGAGQSGATACAKTHLAAAAAALTRWVSLLQAQHESTLERVCFFLCDSRELFLTIAAYNTSLIKSQPPPRAVYRVRTPAAFP